MLEYPNCSFILLRLIGKVKRFLLKDKIGSSAIKSCKTQTHNAVGVASTPTSPQFKIVVIGEDYWLNVSIRKNKGRASLKPCLFFTLEETPNSPPCAYLGSQACSDSVTISPQLAGVGMVLTSLETVLEKRVSPGEAKELVAKATRRVPNRCLVATCAPES